MNRPGRRPILFAAGSVAVVGALAGGVLAGGLTGGNASASSITGHGNFSDTAMKADCGLDYDKSASFDSGHAGTGYRPLMDRCKYEETAHHDYWRWTDMKVVGDPNHPENGVIDPIDQCVQPATGPAMDQAVTYSHTTTATWQVGFNASTDILKEDDKTLGNLGIDASYGQSTANQWGTTTTVHVPAGKEGTLAIGQKMHHSEGKFTLNYNTPVGPNDDDKHYEWYVNSVKIDTPYTNSNIGELSGGVETPDNIFVRSASDVVNCDGKLLGELHPPFLDTDDDHPPSSNLGTPTPVTDSRAVAP